MKKCITCSSEKNNNEFYGKKNECKSCKCLRSKDHYYVHKDELLNYDSLVCRQPEVLMKFMASFEKNINGCWIWKKSFARRGYGQFYIGRKALRSHRVSYLIFKGDIDKRLFVCHSCDTPSCVNPNHLWLGTNEDNLKDMEKKGRRKARGPGLRKDL